MTKTVVLHNVIDTRTEKFHSVVVVKEKDARWFVPVLREEDESDSEE